MDAIAIGYIVLSSCIQQHSYTSATAADVFKSQQQL